MWKGDDNGSDQTNFIGANVIISVGKGIVLPEEHNSDEHYPLIHQVNNGESAERIHYACISGSKFSLVSIVETFSCMSSLAITELLQRGPGHESFMPTIGRPTRISFHIRAKHPPGGPGATYPSH